MDQLADKLLRSNGMVLLSPEDDSIPETTNQGMLPCKKVLAVTPWKRQRNELLFNFLSKFLPKTSQPVLIFANSVVEVNLIANSLKFQFPEMEEQDLKAVGTNISTLDLLHELSNSKSCKFVILSAQMALAAFTHGIIQIQNFSLLCFADARGANQNHPFCIIMNHFYTPLRAQRASKIIPRVLGFGELKSVKEIEKDLFSKRDWIRNLRHYTHIFHSVPMTLPSVDNFAIESYLDAFGSHSSLFDPLSIYESTENQTETSGATIITDLCISEETDSKIILKHETKIDEIPQLFDLLHKIRSHLPHVTSFLHIHRNCPSFSAQFSLYAALWNLRRAAEAPSAQLDPEIATNISKDASGLFSQSEHILSNSQGVSRILRIPHTGALLIESTAIPILVRSCTLLSRRFRQSAANETIQFKTLRVFPIDSEGKRTCTYSSHVSLLQLPVFFYESIKQIVPGSLFASILTDKFHLQGPLVASQHQAQSCVAFEAVKLLRSAGILDDNFLLSAEYRKEDSEDQLQDDPTDIEIDAVALESVETTDNGSELSFNELIPRKLLKSSTVFIYALEFELKMFVTPDDTLNYLNPEPVLLTPQSRLLLSATPQVNFFSVSKSQRSWAILLPSLLPETFIPVEIPIGADHYLKTSLKFIGELSEDSAEYQKILESQQILFGMFNMKPITVPGRGETDQLIADLIQVPEDKKPFYMIAPLIEEATEPTQIEMTSLEDIPRLWEQFKSFVNSFHSAPLEGTLIVPTDELANKNWQIDWKLLESLDIAGDKKQKLLLSSYIEELEKYPRDFGVQLEEGGVFVDFKRFALERLSFYTPHTKIFYRLNRPLPEPVYPSSPFTSATYPHVTTHAEYVMARYGLNVSELEREMLTVKRIENWSDLAVWISDDGASKKRRKNASSKDTTSTPGSLAVASSNTSLIIPELASVFPTSYSTFRLAMFLPRVSFEIERQLRIAQFFEDSLPSTLPKVQHLRQVEAMTASTAALSYSYEQLEVLGDSFLKYYSTLDTLLVGAGWSEGRLSAHRQNILCNANLRRAAEALKLTTYASFTPFFAKLWSPPPLISFLPVPTDPLDTTLNHVLFAPEERWKALAIVEGKQVQRQSIYQLNPSGQLSIDETYKTKEQAKNSTDAIYKYGQLIPPKSLADIVESLIGIYYIDSGVTGALQFLHFCGILKEEIFHIKNLNPVKLMLGEARVAQEEQLEKLKRRKLTPMHSILLNSDMTANTNSTDLSASLKQVQSLDVSLHARFENVLPNAPTFSAFPFTELEAILGHVFTNRELLFMACTHTSVDKKLNGEKLEWIGDAAIDWLVCRHYWYNYRIKSEADLSASDLDTNANDLGTNASDLDTNNPDKDISDLNPCDHPSTPHVPIGYLPLSPETLTNSRQSAINNEVFARLIVKFNLHRFLRIDSPHLQIEIERFADEMKNLENRNDLDLDPSNSDVPNRNILPVSGVLENLHTHVSVAAPKVLGDFFEALMGAILLDCNYDILHFSKCFDPFLHQICPDPSSLPTNFTQQALHLYARLGIPRHQIVCTYREISNKSVLGVICQVWVREKCVSEAEGSNKFVAKRLAMEKALQELTNNPDPYM